MSISSGELKIGARIVCVVPLHTCKGWTGTISHIDIKFNTFDINWDNGKIYCSEGWSSLSSFDLIGKAPTVAPFKIGEHVIYKMLSPAACIGKIGRILDVFETTTPGVWKVDVDWLDKTGGICSLSSDWGPMPTKLIDISCCICQRKCSMEDKICWWCGNKPQG